MAFINLLPWREEAEKAKQREYFTILTMVAVAAFAFVFLANEISDSAGLCVCNFFEFGYFCQRKFIKITLILDFTW